MFSISLEWPNDQGFHRKCIVYFVVWSWLIIDLILCDDEMMVVSQPVSNASFTDSCTSTSCWRMFSHFFFSSFGSDDNDSQTSISLATSKNHWQCLASSPPKPAIILLLSLATNTNCRQRVFYIRLLLARQSCATPCRVAQVYEHIRGPLHTQTHIGVFRF